MKAERKTELVTRKRVLEVEETANIENGVTLSLSEEEAKDICTFFGNMSKTTGGGQSVSGLYDVLRAAGITCHPKDHWLARHATGLHNAFHDLEKTEAWKKYATPSQY